MEIKAWALFVFYLCRSVRSATPCTGTYSLSQTLSSTAGVVRVMLAFEDGSDKVLAAGGEDQIMRVWVNTFSGFPKQFYGHQEAIWAMAWVSDKRVLAVGSGLGFIRFWPIATLLGDPTTCSVFQSVDGSCLGSSGEHVLSWRDAGMSQSHQVHSLAWASDISTLFSGWSDTTIRTWTPSGTAPANIWVYTGVLQSQDRIFDMYYLPTQKKLGTASPDQRHPRVWKGLATKSAPPQVTEDYTLLEITTASTNDGNGDCPWSHCDAVKCLTGKSNTMASGSMDNRVILWDIVAETRSALLTSHTNIVESVVWMSHGNEKLASGSHDNDVRIWDMTSTSSDQASSEQTITPGTAAVNALAFLSDTSGSGTGYLFTGGADGKIAAYTCT